MVLWCKPVVRWRAGLFRHAPQIQMLEHSSDNLRFMMKLMIYYCTADSIFQAKGGAEKCEQAVCSTGGQLGKQFPIIEKKLTQDNRYGKNTLPVWNRVKDYIFLFILNDEIWR